MDAESQERIGERTDAFREMNEHIEGVHERSQVESPGDLLCECGRDDCSERIFLSREEYERAVPTHATSRSRPDTPSMSGDGSSSATSSSTS